MSEISRELLEQQGNMGAVMRKLFPEAAAIDAEEERKKLDAADARAKAILAHVRELGDDYAIIRARCAAIDSATIKLSSDGSGRAAQPTKQKEGNHER